MEVHSGAQKSSLYRVSRQSSKKLMEVFHFDRQSIVSQSVADDVERRRNGHTLCSAANDDDDDDDDDQMMMLMTCVCV